MKQKLNSITSSNAKTAITNLSKIMKLTTVSAKQLFGSKSKILVILFSSFLISCGESTKNKSEEMVVETEDMSNETVVEEQKNAVQIDSAKIKDLKKYFIEKSDEFSSNNVGWVLPKDKPKYRNNNGLYCYFNKSDNSVYGFRLVFQYVNEDWLFIDKMTFLIDGKPIDYNTGNMDRDVNGGGNFGMV